MSTPVQVTPTTKVQPVKVAKKKPPKEESRANWLVRLVLAIVVIGFLIPTIGLFVTSFRPRDDAGSTGWWTALFNPFSSEWTLQNYSDVISGGMGNAFVNSIAVTIPATVIPILIAAMAAYAFTFIEFPGRDTLFIVVVGLLVAWLALVRVRVDHDGVHLQRTGRWRTYRWHDEVVAVGWQPDAGRRRLLVACIVARPKPLVLAPVRSGDAAEVARRLEAIDAVAPSGCVRVDDEVVEPSGVLAWWARHPRAAK